MVNNVMVKDLVFPKRLQHAFEFVKQLKCPTPVVHIKKFHKTSELKKLMTEYIPRIPHPTDGLIFTPINEPLKIGTHETLFKWKERDKNTVDFMVQKGRLYVQEKGEMLFQATLYNNGGYTDGDILECQFVGGAEPWQPIKKRTDKGHPNNRRTYYNTLTNITENIQWEEFL